MATFFWVLTAICCALAGCSVLTPLWVNGRSSLPSLRLKLLLSGALAAVICCCAYALYAETGAGAALAEYYSNSQLQQRRVNKRLQPLYARLQRELLKTHLGYAIDPANERLILNFANIHAQINGGILPDQVVDMLLNVLKSYPSHANALNLLAGHYYKTEQYPQAIAAWEKILLLIPADLQLTKETK